MSAAKQSSASISSGTMADSAVARHNMIDGLLAPNGVSDERVISAMGVVPRELFVPSGYAECAYVDSAIPLAPGRDMMSPIALGRLLQALEIQEHEIMLIVGGGMGYSAAVAANIGARVTLLEDMPTFAAHAVAHMPTQGYGRVIVKQAPLEPGWVGAAPYDVILFDGAVEVWPEAVMSQLNEGGRAGMVEKSHSSPYLTPGMGDVVIYSKEQDQLQRRLICQAAVATIPAFSKKPTFKL